MVRFVHVPKTGQRIPVAPGAQGLGNGLAVACLWLACLWLSLFARLVLGTAATPPLAFVQFCVYLGLFGLTLHATLIPLGGRAFLQQTPFEFGSASGCLVGLLCLSAPLVGVVAGGRLTGEGACSAAVALAATVGLGALGGAVTAGLLSLAARCHKALPELLTRKLHGRQTQRLLLRRSAVESLVLQRRARSLVEGVLAGHPAPFAPALAEFRQTAAYDALVVRAEQRLVSQEHQRPLRAALSLSGQYDEPADEWVLRTAQELSGLFGDRPGEPSFAGEEPPE